MSDLRPLKLPVHEKTTLKNGLVVHLIPRGPLPLVAVRLVTNAGSAFDAKGKEGVADFSGRLMRRGAAGRSADQISEAVDFVGASVGGFANEENVVVSLSTPAKHFEAMFETMAQVALEPEFPEAQLELMRRRTLAQLVNELDDPGELADRALSRGLWGSHPFGQETDGSKKSIEALTRHDLLEFHKQRFGPAVSHLYITGDVSAAKVLPMVERLFGSWKGGPKSRPEIPAWTEIAQPGEVVIVDKPEQTQVQMRIGAKGVRRGHPDHFPLMVMNTALGGGFTSRLVTEIRVKRGLSYGAGSSWDMMTGAGVFTVSSFTKTETINQLIDVALAEVKKMKAKGPTAKELATVQRYISGLYPARLETNEGISSAIADIEHYGLPADWISEYRNRVVAVTPKDAARAAAEHLFDQRRVMVLVGNAKALAPKVKKYGRVSVLKPADLE